MKSAIVGVVVFSMTFGGVLAGMALRKVLPKDHLDDASRDAIKVGIGLIATMSALVLGLVTASAKSAHDAVEVGLRQSAATLLTLDRTLARYGPETAGIRQSLRSTVGVRLHAVWPQDGVKPASVNPLRAGVVGHAERITDEIRALAPQNDVQRALQTRASGLAEELLQARWLSLADSGASVPLPFLVVLVFWLAVTFASFGLFAPSNATVMTVFFVCAVSVASAIFLVLEMESPFSGVLKVSPTTLLRAYEGLGL